MEQSNSHPPRQVWAPRVSLPHRAGGAAAGAHPGGCPFPSSQAMPSYKAPARRTGKGLADKYKIKGWGGEVRAAQRGQEPCGQGETAAGNMVEAAGEPQATSREEERGSPGCVRMACGDGGRLCGGGGAGMEVTAGGRREQWPRRAEGSAARGRRRRGCSLRARNSSASPAGGGGKGGQGSPAIAGWRRQWRWGCGSAPLGRQRRVRRGRGRPGRQSTGRDGPRSAPDKMAPAALQRFSPQRPAAMAAPGWPGPRD